MSGVTTRLNAALEGRYRIERELGEGGMATVYLADDLRHERKVALKVLKPELAAVVGAERFLAEIKTTANLQHPHILPLHDSGEADGFLYYVMPYIEGESLRERLEREKQLAVDEAVRIATDVAEALHSAHQQGVIHRDVKPANILLSQGRPLVADFGIALAVSQAGRGRLTETGLSMGTPYYMSPEQASADREPTPASDVYSLGCVLYEMLVGEPPYVGSSAQAVLAKILMGDAPAATATRASIPTNVDAAIRKSLEKLPADRFASAHDFRSALADTGFRHGADAAPVAGSGKDDATRWKRTSTAATLTAALLGAALVANVVGDRDADEGVERHRVVLGSGVEVIERVSFGVALPPDGSGLLFGDTIGAAGGQVTYWWKPHDQADPVRIPNMDGAVTPTFSPDGEWVAYVLDGELRKQPLRGGSSVLLTDGINAPGAQALGWLDDGTLLFENGGPIVERISEDGGPSDTIATIDQIGYPTHASGLLGGGGALVTSCAVATCVANVLVLVDFERDTIQPLADDVLRAWHVPGEQVVYVDRRGAVFAARLDRDGLRLGPPVPLFDGVAVTDRNAAMQLGADGSLLYLRAGSQGPGAASEFVWVSRSGQATPVDPGWTFDPGGSNWSAQLSPDGTRVALRMFVDGNQDIWVKELPDGPLSRLTFDERDDWSPTWTPDGETVTFTSSRLGNLDVWTKRSDGTGAPELLYGHDRAIVSALWTPDGEWLLLRMSQTGTTADIFALRVGADTVAVPLFAGDYAEGQPAISPDGRWIAYTSNETGANQVFVRPFPDVESGRWQVSTDGGIMPAWAHSGEELFFVDGTGSLVSVQFATGSGFQTGERATLFTVPLGYHMSTVDLVYSVAPDDERFLMARTFLPGSEATPFAGMFLVRNFFEELKRLVPN